MKTLSSQFRFTLFLLFSVVIYSSCKKHEILTPIISTDPLMSLKDSASYSINGKIYTCDIFNSFGRGNTKANRDSATGQWDVDTLQYYSEFGLSKTLDNDRSDDGEINVSFIKKYGKNQLITSTSIPTLLQPKSIIDHYALGRYFYALDFERNNRQNGVRLLVRANTGNQSETLSTQMSGSNDLSSQSNSNFEVIRFDAISSDSSYLLEAKFTANVFDIYGKVTRVESGYLRFRVR